MINVITLCWQKKNSYTRCTVCLVCKTPGVLKKATGGGGPPMHLKKNMFLFETKRSIWRFSWFIFFFGPCVSECFTTNPSSYYTPWKNQRLEPKKNHPIEAEKIIWSKLNLHFWGSKCQFFRRYYPAKNQQKPWLSQLWLHRVKGLHDEPWALGS